MTKTLTIAIYMKDKRTCGSVTVYIICLHLTSGTGS